MRRQVSMFLDPPKWTPANMGLGIAVLLVIYNLLSTRSGRNLVGFYSGSSRILLPRQCCQNLLLSPNRARNNAWNSARSTPA